MNGFKVIAAYDQNIPVSGIYIRKIGTFTVNKGIAPITVDQYEYAFNFRVNGRSYRSMFGKESDYGKVGADGKWQSWALEKAVEARLRFEKNAINGVRPTSVKEERELNWKAAEDKKRQEQQEKTVEELVNLFLIDISNTGPGIKTNAPRTINEHRLNLKRDVVPVIGERKAKKITRRDISAILGTIAQRGAFVQSNRTKSSCCRLFNWAVDKDWVPYNPCANMSKYVEKPRERVLTEEEPKEDTGTPPSHKEIKTLCLKLMEHRELPEARILLLCILLGSREGEICNMYWENIDNQNWLTIHPDKTKTDVELACFLTPTASDLLGAKRKKGLIFTLKTKSDQAFSVNNLSKFVRDNEYFGLSPWQPRDLRRTFTTLAKSFNASNFIVNLAQARKDDSVLRKHYDKRRYYKELKELFLTIEQEILRITSQEN
jgi:integrase